MGLDDLLGSEARVGASLASAGFAAVLPALGGTACNTGLVDIADDGGEVAIADPDLAAARVGTKSALGVAEIFERRAAERADERLARALHRVFGVDGFSWSWPALAGTLLMSNPDREHPVHGQRNDCRATGRGEAQDLT